MTGASSELGRCYIREDLRRMGVGSLLLDHMVDCCRAQGYERIYLHTHRHLPGGLDFWQKKNFAITVEELEGQKSVHMERKV